MNQVKYHNFLVSLLNKKVSYYTYCDDLQSKTTNQKIY